MKLHNQFEIIAEAVEDGWRTDAGLRSVPTHEKGQKQSDSQLELETSSSFVKASTTSYGNTGFGVFKQGIQIRKILPNHQHTQRKLVKFEFWINGRLSKSAEI